MAVGWVLGETSTRAENLGRALVTNIIWRRAGRDDQLLNMRALSVPISLGAICAVVAAGVIAGCGGSSTSSHGVATKSPQAIVAAAQAATAAAKSVRVSGSIVSAGTRISLDLSMAAGRGGRGQMSQDGLSFQMVALNQTVYINGSQGFWRHIGGAAAAQLFDGRWLKAPANGQFASIARLANINQLFGQLLGSHGTLAKGKTTTVDGQKVVAITDTTKGGTLYVATTGKPYPVEVTKGNSGRVVFDRFNDPVSLAAPPNAIDISQLKGQ